METKTYVKMCDCPEIQGQWNPQEKIAYFLKYISGSIGWHIWKGTNLEPPQKHFKWFPRQSEIQEMFKGHECGLQDPFVLAGRFSNEMENFITGDPSWWTMEGLWLAYYMWKKYGKIWDGKEWVAEES